MRIVTLAFAAFALAGVVTAQAQTTAGVTATCKDGTDYSGPSRRGACARHGGVQAFGTAAAVSPSAPATPPSTTGTVAPVATPIAPVSPRPTAPQNRVSAPLNSTPSGGGSGQVWVNTASKVYHCPGTRYYGKTKQGEYMAEGAAKAAGDRADHGKACTS